MRKHVLLSFLLIGLMLPVVFVASVKFVFAQTDFNAYLGTAITDGQIDGVIGSEWEDAGKFTNVSINPTGVADVWTKHDETYLYIALNFTADSNNPWVAFQFVGGDCMKEGVDGALFGHDNFSANSYQDIIFGGPPFIVKDSVQDGIGVINVDSSNMVTVELKKPLSSSNTVERDMSWTAGNEYAMIIMWDSDGGGSSGGTTDHMGGSRATKTILISTDTVPEFSTIAAIVVLVAVLVLTTAFKAKHVHKHSF